MKCKKIVTKTNTYIIEVNDCKLCGQEFQVYAYEDTCNECLNKAAKMRASKVLSPLFDAVIIGFTIKDETSLLDLIVKANDGRCWLLEPDHDYDGNDYICVKQIPTHHPSGEI